MNLTRDVKEILSPVVSEPIFRSSIPDIREIPDDLVALYEYAGLPLDDTDGAFLQPSLQVVIRDSEYDRGLERAYRIFNALKAVGNAEKGDSPIKVGSTQYFKFSALQTPYKLKEDEAGRVYIVQNFRVWARPTEQEE